MLYDLVRVIWKVLYPAMNDESFVRDCLPLPPTPEKSAHDSATELD